MVRILVSKCWLDILQAFLILIGKFPYQLKCLMWEFSAVSFHLSIALAAFHTLFTFYLHFCSVQCVFNSPWVIHLWHGLIQSVLFSFQLFRNFPTIYPLLISGLTSLLSENTFNYFNCWRWIYCSGKSTSWFMTIGT